VPGSLGLGRGRRIDDGRGLEMIGCARPGCQPRRLRRRLAGVCGGAVLAFGLAGVSGVSPALAQTCRPSVGAQGTSRFTVWYCQGDGKARQATGKVARLLDAAWPEETRPEPNGLGPPLTPEANGGRISVYVAAPNEEVDLGACPEFCEKVGSNFGIAQRTAPFQENSLGAPISSGAMIINENIGINDATVIHEFFHVLEFGHSEAATASWLGEASATWAEAKYRATDTTREGFFRDFQRTTTASLTRIDPGHHYGAYVWFLWLAQRVGGDQAVFGLWSALEGVRSSNVAEIDPVVGIYLATLGLSWARSFKDFAVEDLDRNLSRTVTPRLFGRGPFGDPAVPLNVTPRFLRPPSTLSLGTRRTPVSLRLLSAQYEYLRAVGGRVRAVVITANRMRPWGDLVILAHTRFGWQRRDLQNGSVSFCRQKPGQNVDQLYLIADNHDDLQNHSEASYTVTGKTRCS
jgi:hypothetical protein